MENLYTGLGDHIVEGPCCDAKKAVERIDRMNDKFGDEVLGFCLDTGHANLVGIDIEDFVVTLGHRLKVLHVHDNDGRMDLHQIPFTFTRSRENNASTNREIFRGGDIKFCSCLTPLPCRFISIMCIVCAYCSGGKKTLKQMKNDSLMFLGF